MFNPDVVDDDPSGLRLKLLVAKVGKSSPDDMNADALLIPNSLSDRAARNFVPPGVKTDPELLLCCCNNCCPDDDDP